jgi:2'-5' RNA ligase
MHIFIAFSIPDEIKQHLVAIQHHLTKLYRDMPVRFTKSDLLHLTLEFVGDISPAQLSDLRQTILPTVLDDIRSSPVWLDHLDGFPNIAHPHVLVARVSEEHHVLLRLHNQLQTALAEHGFQKPDEHVWQPHITLGRLRHSWDCPTDLREAGLEKLVWDVNELLVLESVRHGHDVRYTVLDRFTLLPPASPHL